MAAAGHIETSDAGRASVARAARQRARRGARPARPPACARAAGTREPRAICCCERRGRLLPVGRRPSPPHHPAPRRTRSTVTLLHHGRCREILRTRLRTSSRGPFSLNDLTPCYRQQSPRALGASAGRRPTRRPRTIGRGRASKQSGDGATPQPPPELEKRSPRHESPTPRRLRALPKRTLFRLDEAVQMVCWVRFATFLATPRFDLGKRSWKKVDQKGRVQKGRV